MDESYTQEATEAAAQAPDAVFMGLGVFLLVVILVAVILPPFITMFCARSRGRGMIRWFLFGWLLSWFGPLLVLLLGHSVAGEAKRNVKVGLKQTEIEEKVARRKAAREAKIEEKVARRKAAREAKIEEKVARRKAAREAKTCRP